MLRRIAVLVVIPLALAVMGFGGRMVMERSWDELVNHQSPYTAALPVGQGGEALTDQVVIVLQDGLRVDTSAELEAWNELRAQRLTATPMARRCVTVNRSIDSAAALGKRGERARVTRIPRADHLADRLAHNGSRLGRDPTLGDSVRATADYGLFTIL